MVPTRGRVRLEVYNLLGQRIRTLVEGSRQAGTYEVAWDGRDEAGRQVTAGVYVHRLVAPGYMETRKMTLLR